MKIEIKSWKTGKVIFEHNADNNTIKKTVEKAVCLGIVLDYAELNRVKLNGAQLSGAQLNYAQLNGAQLNYAQLNRAELNYAELNYAELNYAELNRAQLNGAELNTAQLINANGNLIEIKNISLDKWKIVFTKTDLAIGCKQFPITEWKFFSDKEINNLDESALIWWKKWKDIIFIAINLSFKEEV